MLRALAVALLLANLVFFVWTQGWLDAVAGVRASGDREPERLARQVRPETVRIVSAGSGTEPAAAALACLEAGPFGEAEFSAAQAALAAALPGSGWVAARTEQSGTWIVYMGKFPNREILNKKREELERRKLPYELVQGNPALEPGLSLGRYDERAPAAKALEEFTAQGVRSARVVELIAAQSRQWLRYEKADAALAGKLAALRADALGKGFAACEKGPGS